MLLDAARQKNFPAVILRVAGIYGPGRGHLFQQYLRNEAKIAGKGERFINMIHLDDVVGAIIAALKSGKAGDIYNAVDDEPVAQIHFFRWLSETLGKEMPPFATGSGKCRPQTRPHEQKSAKPPPENGTRLPFQISEFPRPVTLRKSSAWTVAEQANSGPKLT